MSLSRFYPAACRQEQSFLGSFFQKKKRFFARKCNLFGSLARYSFALVECVTLRGLMLLVGPAAFPASPKHEAGSEI